MKKYYLILFVLCILIFACTENVKTQAEVPSKAKSISNVALLVGINKYSNLAERWQLHGCVNDVNLMARLLEDKFQFDNIRVLIDEQATRKNILSEFENFLIKNAQPDGQAVFYYSGHGSQMTDLDLDEQDGYDETIVPHDSRDSQQKVIDIPDDILGSLLSKLTDKCKNVTIILDCCQSGSGVRGETAIPRQIPPLELDQPKSKATQAIEDGPSGFLPPDPDYVLISACHDREYAYESNGHGILTLGLNELMQKKPNATYRELMYEVSAKVTAEQPSQHPQTEGKRRDAKIFGNLGRVENFIEAVDVQGGKVQVNAGSAHNVTAGSIYALYMPGTTSMKSENKLLGKVRIVKVEPFFSWGEITEKKVEIVKNAAAFEIAHHYGDLQLAVHLDLKGNPELQRKIEAVLNDYKNKEDLLKIVSRNSPYDVNIRFDGNSNKLILERQDLMLIKSLPPDDNSIQYDMPEALTKLARWLNIFRLDNSMSGLKVEMKMQRWEKMDENYNPLNELQIQETKGGQRILNAGDIIKLTIKNISERDVYIYLLDLGSDGSVSLLFPAPGAKDSPLAPERSIETSLMQISPPEGLDVLKVIATSVQTDFSVLVQTGFRAIDATTTARGLDSPLGKLLNLVWGGKRNVNIIQPKEIDDWTTGMISFMIQSRKE